MNHEEQELVYDLAFDKISEDQFIELFFSGGEVSEDYLCQEFERAFASKDASSVECLLIFGFVFGFSTNCSDILSRLLIQGWHFRHEDIARALKPLKYAGAVENLFKTALANYPYTGSEYALGVKCIYALREVGTDRAKEKLRMLAQVENPVLSELAGRLLSSM
jgi:hypothetical protein